MTGSDYARHARGRLVNSLRNESVTARSLFSATAEPRSVYPSPFAFTAESAPRLVALISAVLLRCSLSNFTDSRSRLASYTLVWLFRQLEHTVLAYLTGNLLSSPSMQSGFPPAAVTSSASAAAAHSGRLAPPPALARRRPAPVLRVVPTGETVSTEPRLPLGPPFCMRSRTHVPHLVYRMNCQ